MTGASRRSRAVGALAVAALICAAATRAQSPPAERGERIARTWCATCHLVDETAQASALADAPSFASLAARADLDETAIASALLLPHPIMPDFALSRDDIRALHAYIKSRAEGEPPRSGDRSAAERVVAGLTIARTRCARCHAVAGPGPSPVADAPPFSTLSQSYPVESLAEALAEGILVAHSTIDMPEFTFEPDEIEALLAFLETVQE